ncbi:unnamed protein product [Cochlearia groenlandica]
MKIDYYNKINEHPTQEDVGRITIFARIFGEDGNNLTFFTTTLIETFIYNDEECESKRDLDDFWAEVPGIDDDCGDVLRELVLYVCELNCPLSYAIEVRIDITPNHLVEEEDEEEEVYDIEETVNILFRPARKDVLKSLMRKIYKKMSMKKEQDDDMDETFTSSFLRSNIYY